MHFGVDMVDGLKEQIIDDRELSPDKSSVTYKLADNLDFSRSREFTRILADIFFEKDYSLKKKRTVRSKKTWRTLKRVLRMKCSRIFIESCSFHRFFPHSISICALPLFSHGANGTPLHIQKLLDEVMKNTTIRYIWMSASAESSKALLIKHIAFSGLTFLWSYIFRIALGTNYFLKINPSFTSMERHSGQKGIIGIWDPQCIVWERWIESRIGERDKLCILIRHYPIW